MTRRCHRARLTPAACATPSGKVVGATVKLGERMMQLYSVYIRPAEREGDDAGWVEELNKLRNIGCASIVGGDFNAKHFS